MLSTANYCVILGILLELVADAIEIASFQLIGARASESYRQALGPVYVDFEEVSGYVCSNLKIRDLRVFDRDASYTPMKWLRYITTADSYTVKLV